jgi:hypothetical protein
MDTVTKFNNVTREISGSFPSGYAMCEVLEAYGDQRRMKCRYTAPNGATREFYARHALGHVLETRVVNEVAFKGGAYVY